MNANCELSELMNLLEGRRVFFVTTKNLDYLRNTQEIRIIKELASEIEILGSNKNNNIIRIIDIWLKLFKKNIRDKEIIFIGFEPQFVLPLFYRKFRNKIIIIDFFISVYDTLVCDRKKVREGSILSKICHRIDDSTIGKADLIIADTKAHRDYFIQEFGALPKRVYVLYLEADSSIYYPREQNKPQALRDKYVVLYFGSILPVQGVGVVLETIRYLDGENDIYFDIIGPIQRKYNKPKQRNVEYHEWLNQEELAEHIANADLCLAGHFDSDINKAKRTIPGKAYIYEAMGKKMILGDTPANHELFGNSESVVFVELGNSEKLKERIYELSIKNKRTRE